MERLRRAVRGLGAGCRGRATARIACTAVGREAKDRLPETAHAAHRPDACDEVDEARQRAARENFEARGSHRRRWMSSKSRRSAGESGLSQRRWEKSRVPATLLRICHQVHLLYAPFTTNHFDVTTAILDFAVEKSLLRLHQYSQVLCERPERRRSQGTVSSMKLTSGNLRHFNQREKEMEIRTFFLRKIILASCLLLLKFSGLPI